MTMFDVVVVGAAGGMGSAACYHLARRGARVLGLDQFRPGHARGSSHGSSRMIRMCYYEHPDYVPLLRRAYELWDNLEQSPSDPAGSGPVFRRTGGVYMGLPDSPAVSGSLRAARECDLAHELWSRRELEQRFPQFEVGEDFVALFEPEAGFVVPEEAISRHLHRARQAGAELRWDTPVRSITPTGDGVRVELDGETVVARGVVLTTGAWAGSNFGLLPRLVHPTRQVVGWVAPPRPERFGLGECPVWAIDASHLGEGLYYGFPLLTGPHQRPGLKIARHASGESISADDPSREPQPGDEATFRPCLRRWIPAADGPTASIAVCLYESSPDSHFIIDRHPAHPSVVIACGFSGHGFKFTSVVGEILADLALDGRTRHPIEFLGLTRFGQTE